MSIYLCVDRHPSYKIGGYQLSIDDENGGTRLYGPKYDGSSEKLLRHTISENDASVIRDYLDSEFPPRTISQLTVERDAHEREASRLKAELHLASCMAKARIAELEAALAAREATQ